LELKGGNAGELTVRGNTNPVCQICGGSKIDRGKGICKCDNPEWEAINKPMQNYHPTVKPISLMQYLCRLTKTPKGGIVLDPYAGSGSTLVACILEGREFIGIDREEEYCQIAKKRISLTENHHCLILNKDKNIYNNRKENWCEKKSICCRSL
jgi:DNA modification methylase